MQLLLDQWTILIVDDRPTNREFLVTLLRYSNHELLEASDGAEALEFIFATGAYVHRNIRNHPKLVILDLKLPKVDGLALCRRLRERGNRAARGRDRHVLVGRVPGLGAHERLGRVRALERAGIRVCEAMAKRGVLTRPIGNVIALLPPYCTTVTQARQMVKALREGIEEIFPPKKS